MRGLAVIALALFGLVSQSEAKCKAHHTSWKLASQGPLVSQPVSSNPEKVKVSWAGMMKNQRCVDWYTVSIRKGDDLTQTRFVNVTGPNTVSLDVTVDPCNYYYFQVEFSQQSFWRSKIHKYSTGVTKFKTQGIPKLKPGFDWRYDLNIHYKLEDGVHNLFKPIVSFRKEDMLINGDCISGVSLEPVKPIEQCHRIWNTTSCTTTVVEVYKEAKDDFASRYIHDAINPVHDPMNVHPLSHIHSHYHENEDFDEMQGIFRGDVDAAFKFLMQKKNNTCPVVRCPKCRTRREANGQTGQTFYPEQNGQSGQTYNPQANNGGTGGTWYPERRDQNADRRGYGGTFVEASSSHQRRNHNDRRPRRSITTKRPPVILAKKGSVNVTPPFVGKRVELEMDTSQHGQPCKHPLFVEMSVNAANGIQLLKIRDIRIPLIHETTLFVPPTMSMVVKEILTGQGHKIPAECIPLYMLAIDANVRQTHEQVNFFQNQYEKLENITHEKLEHKHPIANVTANTTAITRTAPVPVQAALPDRDHHKKKEMLKRLGCLCHFSEFVKVNVSDDNANYYYPNTTGTYEFTGKEYNGKPYYTLDTTSGGSEVTYYLYYYQPQDTWYIDDNLGDRKPKLSIVGNYNRCPGDMSIIRVAPPKWQYVKSLVWYNIKHMSVSCGIL